MVGVRAVFGSSTRQLGVDMPQSASTIWRSRLARHKVILILLGLGLLAGLILGNDYGMTFDEERNVIVGERALRTYTGDDSYYRLPALPDHGPAYFMMFSASSRAIHAVWPAWTEADGRHFTNFLTFLLAVAGFYAIALRLLSHRGAWMTTALFASQPLLFGQGFINQKDTPFMGFFVATVAAGLFAADAWSERRGDPVAGESVADRWEDFRYRLSADWKARSPWFRRSVIAALIFTGLVTLDLFLIGGIRSVGESTIRAAYQGSAPGPIQLLFNQVATDAYKTPVALYLSKWISSLRLLRWIVPAAVLFGLFLFLSWRLSSLGSAWGMNRAAWGQRWLITSAVLLGVTVCVRQLGLFAGGLVGLVFLYRSRLRGLFPLAVYGLYAGTVTVISWPWLWPNPVGRFIQSMLLGVSFPSHRTFYQGRWISSSILPWHYFPTLASLELTLPTILLIAGGGLLAAWRLIQGDRRWFWIGLLGIWFGVPLIGLIGFDMTIYGNIRHLLFILPPLLIIAGLALEWLVDLFINRWLRWGLFALAIAPGIWGIVQLHPYEYIYMNQLVGGVSGAQGRYELDRQCISLRGGIEILNQIAEPGASVMVMRQISQVVPNARPDLLLIDNRQPFEQADYLLSCRWPDYQDFQDQGFEPINGIGAGGAVLTDVWRRVD
ncbi:MAG: hypothetical protein WBR18_02520 [Anaerolineales bacterium]